MLGASGKGGPELFALLVRAEVDERRDEVAHVGGATVTWSLPARVLTCSLSFAGSLPVMLSRGTRPPTSTWEP